MNPLFNIYNLTLEECDLIALALDGLLCNDDVGALIDKQVVDQLFERFDQIADVPEIESAPAAVSVERVGNLLRVEF